MKLTIDTNLDSKEDIKKAIFFLSKFLKEGNYIPNKNYSSSKISSQSNQQESNQQESTQPIMSMFNLDEENEFQGQSNLNNSNSLNSLKEDENNNSNEDDKPTIIPY